MRILHTMLRVGDLQRSIGFYTGVLGMVVLQRNHREGAMIEAVTGIPGAVVEIAHVAFPEQPEMRVLVIDPGDMNTEMHALAEPGVDLSHLPLPDAVAPRILEAVA